MKNWMNLWAISSPLLVNAPHNISNTEGSNEALHALGYIYRFFCRRAVLESSIFLLFISSCANIQTPTGGIKDTQPPAVKFAKPPNKSLLFNSKQVKIRFDEYIQSSLNPQEIIISPPLNELPKMYVEGKNLHLLFKEEWKKNTTYTINFGEAIKDNNEGNVLKNITYVFSTGIQLDSAKAKGIITEAGTQKEAEDVIVALYPLDATTNITSSKPYYFTKTKSDGSFQFENLHPGQYRAYALIDKNLNYIYDQPNEKIGFLDSAVTLSDTIIPNFSISIFEQKQAIPKLTEAIAIAPGHIRLIFTGTVQTFALITNIYDNQDQAFISQTRDTVDYWYVKRWEKTAKINITTNEIQKDSVSLKLKWIEKDSLKNSNRFSIHIENQLLKQKKEMDSVATSYIQSPFKPLLLPLSLPVSEIRQPKAIEIVNDSTKETHIPELKLDELSRKVLELRFPMKEKTSYSVVIPAGVITDYTGATNPPMRYNFKTDEKINYGNITLNLNIEHPDKHYIFKILDAAGAVVETKYYTGSNQFKLQLKNMPAGTYKIQAIQDNNKNGEWDSGDFYTRRQPEPIINFRDSYELKGGWDLEVDVKL